MKIHQDDAVATATPSRKAVSFREMDLRHSGRKPLRETSNRTPGKSPHFNAKSGTPFKSPSSTTKSVTSNSFRQSLKKGFTPSSTKTISEVTTDYEKENNVEASNRGWRQEYDMNQKPKTPGSASALRRTLRSTVQPQENKQQQTFRSLQQKRISLKTSSNVTSKSEPFQSVATALSLSSSYSTSNLLGRSRLLGKGGVAPGKSMLGGLGPPTRVAPKTPNTILRTELDGDDEFDESFLLSPPPGALWNALNLTSAGGDKGSTISPTVTTGLIVVSPQAAEQIHSWSSSKKRLSSMDSSPEMMSDLVSPTVPRALMQTPQVSTTTTTHSFKSSPVVEHETNTKQIESVTRNETSHSVKDESISIKADIQSTSSNTEGEKSTKGGASGFFSLTDNESWSQNEPLSAKMPAALRSRLMSNRPKPSKTITNQDTNSSSTVPKLSSSRTKSVSTEGKPPVKRSTTTSTTRNVTKTSTTTNSLKKKTTLVKETTTKNTVKNSKRHESKSTLRAGSKDLKESERKPVTKPWKREVTKHNKLVDKTNVTSIASDQKEAVKPWKKRGARRILSSKGVENKKSKSTIDSLMNPEFSKTKGSIAFDISFNDADNAEIPLKKSTNRRSVANPLAKNKHKDSSDSQTWEEKQCEVFVGWLNYTLNPEELDVNGDCIASGLRALIIHRRLAGGRLNALQLFKGDSMFQVRTIIAKEITKGKLSIRSDRDVTVDVHLRKKLTSLLLSYTTPWLRMALEVMSGEVINPVPISEDGPKVCLRNSPFF